MLKKKQKKAIRIVICLITANYWDSRLTSCLGLLRPLMERSYTTSSTFFRSYLMPSNFFRRLSFFRLSSLKTSLNTESPLCTPCSPEPRVEGVYKVCNLLRSDVILTGHAVDGQS